ncbi:MAG: outer membrane protein assembly factor BamD [Polyangiaceae bacterium]|nr:outer membrane protein assembly factor BamD [Polyangiaceae bacterium]
MRPLVLAALIATSTAVGVVGCKKDASQALTALEFQTNAKAAYELALESFYRGEWVVVPELMAEVKREYAGTRYARLAQLRIADAQFHAGEYPESVTSYREFLRDYPNDPEVPYARYRVILCQFESRGESSMQPPLEERDLASVRDADRGITRFLRDYPHYPEMERILYMQEWVRGMLARHELYVARFYLQRDNYRAAIARAEYALVNYSSTGLEPEALVILGETYLKNGQREEAREAFQIVLNKYPTSPFVAPARRFIKLLP